MGTLGLSLPHLVARTTVTLGESLAVPWIQAAVYPVVLRLLSQVLSLLIFVDVCSICSYLFSCQVTTSSFAELNRTINSKGNTKGFKAI